MIRAVLDTNVMISSVLTPAGTPGRVVRAMKARAFELQISDQLFAEIERVLRRLIARGYVRFTENDIREFLGVITKGANFFKGELQIKRVILDDPDDDVVLATALWAKADFIVSGDRHLQALGEYESIRIVTPRQFLEMIRGESSIF